MVQASGSSAINGTTAVQTLTITSMTQSQIDALVGLRPVAPATGTPNPGTGNDTVLGSAGNDELDGLGGNDLIFGLGGRNTVFGSAGNDTIVGEGSVDLLIGEDGNDVFWVSSQSATVRGSDGDDIIIVSSPGVVVEGGGGRDTVIVLSPGYAPRAAVEVEEVIYLNTVLPTDAVAAMALASQRNVAGAPPSVFTYMFVESPPPGFEGSRLPEGESLQMTVVDATMRDVFRRAANLFEAVANIRFVEVTSVAEADIAVGRHNMNGTIAGYAQPTAPGSRTAAPFMVNSNSPTQLLLEGTDGFNTMIHELGHSVGIGHPFDGEVRLSTADGVNGFLSMMSYGDGYSYHGLMAYDIETLRWLYGAGQAVNPGDTVYSFTALNISHPAIVDDGGNDTINVSTFTTASTINLASGSLSLAGYSAEAVLRAQNLPLMRPELGNISITRGTIIENAVTGAGNDTIRGNDSANRLTGNAGNDTLEGGRGNDTLDGGAGTDTAVFSGARAAYTIVTRGSSVTVQHTAAQGDGTDTLISVEFLRFADGTIRVPAAADPFAISYGARNPDLLAVFGLDPTALVTHFIQFGRAEGRQATGFSAEAYAARNPDLFSAYGLDTNALITHFQGFGRNEGRAATGFSAEAYAARNPDLYAVFGLSNDALVNHFVQFGSREGRQATGFSAEAYAARNPDLFNVFGLDADALVRHYVNFGRNEGRQATGFTASEYAALNPDLFGVFGLNTEALVRHYVNFGRAEGRQAALAQPGTALVEPLDVLGITDAGAGSPLGG
ncbi:MAG: hypothetical protein RLY86_22 [Pseudomonadota bacterium]